MLTTNDLRAALVRADKLVNWMAGYIGKMAPGDYHDCYTDLNTHGLFMGELRKTKPETLWIVRQYPRPRFRGGLRSIVGIFEATSGAAAIRKALEEGKDNDFGFTNHGDYCRPTVEPFTFNKGVVW